MNRKASKYEVQAAHQLREEAREYVGELYPGAKVDLDISDVDGQLGVAAKIGDTQPHSRDDVMGCLVQLGVNQVMFAKPTAA